MKTNNVNQSPRILSVSAHHYDTCLPDYFGGHHWPHVAIPVFKGMTFAALRRAIRGEIRQGAVAGSTLDARILQADYIDPRMDKYATTLTRKVYAAINRDIVGSRKGSRVAFPNIERGAKDYRDNEDMLYCYIIFEVLADNMENAQ